MKEIVKSHIIQVVKKILSAFSDIIQNLKELFIQKWKLPII